MSNLIQINNQVPSLIPKKRLALNSEFMKERDFNNYLKENLHYLNIDLNLKLDESSDNSIRENSVGPYKEDILVLIDDSEGKVIIESQFGRTDHKHLGQILTYSSNEKEVTKAIWICEKYTQEHKEVFNNLNNINKKINYYLVKASIIKINNEKTLNFELINNNLKDLPQINSSKLIHPRNKKLHNYWKLFVENGPEKYRHRTPTKYRYFGSTTGTTGIGIDCALVKKGFYICLSISTKDKNINNKFFDQLEKQRSEIETKYGEELDWINDEGIRGCYIQTKPAAGGWEDTEQGYKKTVENMTKSYEKFCAVLRGYINQVKEFDKYQEEAINKEGSGK